MPHDNAKVLALLRGLNLGSSIAEQDDQLEAARIDTSAFHDLVEDRVDLILGTKGSGKTALYRIIVNFLRSVMLEKRRVVVAHGVDHEGDQVFQAFISRFGQLSENDFVNFWCVYFVSLAHEQFVKSPAFSKVLKPASKEVRAFKAACVAARIPSFDDQKTFREVLDWALTTVQAWMPKRITVRSPENGPEFEVDLFGAKVSEKDTSKTGADLLPVYVGRIKQCLEAILERAGLNLWFMVDRLDEIFPRRSDVETRALRGLLRVLRIFTSPAIRVKIFLRDDILEQIVEEKEFIALTHVLGRKANPLKWTEDEILCLIVRRLFASKPLAQYLKVSPQRLSSVEEAREAFYKVFAPAIYRGDRRRTTLGWIYSRAGDGRGVVTPRDVIDMIKNAVQHQQELLKGDPDGECDVLLTSAAIRAGFERMSKDKATNYIKAEFRHIAHHIERLRGRAIRNSYPQQMLQSMFAREPDGNRVIMNLVSMGILTPERKRTDGMIRYRIPFLYRASLAPALPKMRY
jgi:hypothetical protein